MRRFLSLVGVLTVTLGATAVMQTPAAQEAPPGDAETGRKLFVSVGCYQCHGYEAQGASATGPRLGPNPLPWVAFSAYVRRPANQMPAYPAVLVSNDDLAHIYAFIASRPAPSADVPALMK